MSYIAIHGPECPWPIAKPWQRNTSALNQFYAHYTALISQYLKLYANPSIFAFNQMQDIKILRVHCRHYIDENLMTLEDLNIVTNECYHMALEKLQSQRSDIVTMMPLTEWNFLKL